jgi:hypothetical protein
MANSEEVRLIIKAATEQAVANIEKLNGTLGKTEQQGGKTTSTFGKLKSSMLAVTVVAAGVAVAVNKMTNAASDQNEAQNKFNEIFKSSKTALAEATKGVNELNASYGVSKTEALELTSTMGGLLQNLGYLPEEAANLSSEMVKLAADMGSFNNVPTADALNAIRSAFIGETEPIRRFNVVINEATLKQEALNMGLRVGTGTLDAHTKAQATLSLIMKNTTAQQGDMIRTGDSYANQQKQLKKNIEDVSAAFGQILIPAMTAITSALSGLLGWVAKLSDGWKIAISVFAAAGIAIALLTKIAVAFGVTVSAAIWPVTLVVLALAAAVAEIVIVYKKWDNMSTAMKVALTVLMPVIVAIVQIIKNWSTILYGLEVAWQAVQFGFEVVVQSFKVGFAWIALTASKAVDFFATPILEAINVVIAGLNKLPGVNIESLNTVFESTVEHNQAMLDQELERLANLEIADIEHKTRKEETEATHQDNMNNIMAESAAKETAILDSKLKNQIAVEQAFSEQYKGIQLTQAQAIKAIKDQEAIENKLRFDQEVKDRLEKQIEYNKKSSQIDTELLKLKIENKGIDVESTQNAWDFIYNSLDQSSKKQFKIWKAMSIANAMVATFQAAINAYNAMAGIPYVGPALGAVAAATAATFGALQVNRIRNTEFKGAEEGALIRGTPGSYGTLIRAGENNKDEAIIPLEDSGIMGKMGTTVNIYNETAIMDEEYPKSIALKIDNALYKLKQQGLSKSL